MKLKDTTPVVKIDEYLRQFGYTVCEAYFELRYSVYKETETGWKCEHDFYSKQQLVDFAGGLK